MKVIQTNLLTIIFSILLFSCNNTETKKDASQNEVAEINTEQNKAVGFNSPCDLFSLEEVKNMFKIAEIPIEKKDVVYTYPTCVYKWQDGKVTTTTSFGGQEIISKMPSEVLIVMVNEATESMFKQSTSIYKQPQEISNVGKMAIWDSRMSQLTFLSYGYMFHVHLRVTNNDSDNKEKAVEVSKIIIGKI